ncbi:MFS transporter [Paenibacillus sp. GCM10027627]|uniref:MFS transporter n=1 Tax=unclassified Paenibacillus TaxID=185978 RepID=UPI00362F8652
MVFRKRSNKGKGIASNNELDKKRLKSWMQAWRNPSILLAGIGLSSVGGWIYFIALNLMVLDMTKSALAVSVLYMIKPISAFFTNVWSGSFIDRVDKRKLMVILDVVRAILIAMLPLYDSLWYIYLLVFFIHMGGNVFGPASVAYTAELISPAQRVRFNSIHALIGSGAFLIGPAIAGLLVLAGSAEIAIYINAAAMLVSGLITLALPSFKPGVAADGTEERISEERITAETVKRDWRDVFAFYRMHPYIWAVCFLFGSVMMVMASAVDSLEAAFAKVVLGLTEGEYGVLVSVAGVGIIAGAGVNALLAKKVSVSRMMALGVLGVCGGYAVYAFSSSFGAAAGGFFVLAFFQAFANAGFATYYQNHIPVELMGRIGSVNGFVEAVLILLTTLAFGVAAEWGTIQGAVMAGVLLMGVIGVVFAFCAWRTALSERLTSSEARS